MRASTASPIHHRAGLGQAAGRLRALTAMTVALAVSLCPALCTAGTWTYVGTNPDAAAQPTAWGRELGRLQGWNGKLYSGFGDWQENTGPIWLNEFDPVARTFVRRLSVATDSVDNFRIVNGRLLIPWIDPVAGESSGGMGIGDPGRSWRNSKGLEMVHCFDTVTLTGTDLWLVGSGNATTNGPDGAKAYRSLDNGVTWTDVCSDNAGGGYWDRFYWAGVLHGKLYIQNSWAYPAATWVFDGATWTAGPPVSGYTTHAEVFAGKLVLATGSFLLFDGITTTNTGVSVVDYAIAGTHLYALRDVSGYHIFSTTNMTAWTDLGTIPTNITARCVGVVGGKLYVGTADSTIYEYSDPVPLDDSAPSVGILAPVSGKVFTTPANVTINASASNIEGTIARVEFFDGAAKLGEDATAPYDLIWSVVPPGTHGLTAVATDLSGRQSTSAVTVITVTNMPPTITTQPADRAVAAGFKARFLVSATGSTPLACQWYRNDAGIGAATATTYAVAATTLADDGALFYVVITNAYGSVTSVTATLNVFPDTATNDGWWAVDASGNWSGTNNWTSGNVANGASQTAWLTSDISAARTITVDTNSRTLGTVNVGDADASHSFTLAASDGAWLTLSNNGSHAHINQVATSYSNTFTLVLGLADPVDIGNASAYPLTLAGAITNVTTGLTTLANLGTGTGGVTLSGIVGKGVGPIGLIQNSRTSTLILGAANTYAGDTEIIDGTLKVGVTQAIPGGAGKGNVLVNGTLDVGFANTINGLSGTGKVDNTTGTAATLTVGDNDQTSLFAGFITNTGSAASLALTKTGAGMLTLAGTNGYGGVTAVTAGSLAVRNGSALGTTVGATVVSGGATLQIEGNGIALPEALTLNGTGTANAGSLRNVSGDNVCSGTITLGSASRIQSDAGTLMLRGAITGAFGLTMGGPGAIVLSGPASYTGATTISNGTLLVNGSLTAGGADVTVGPQAILGGTGIISRAVTVIPGSGALAGGCIAPGGNSLGTLTINGTLTLMPASIPAQQPIWSVQLGAAASDLLALNGSFVMANTGRVTLAVANTGDARPNGRSFVLLTWTNTGPAATGSQFDVVALDPRWTGGTVTVNATTRQVLLDGLVDRIINVGATNITDTAADLIANLTATGVPAATVWAFWDTADHATNKTWAHCAGTMAGSPGRVTIAATGLASNQTYYYTCCASNADDEVWARPSLAFRTGGPPSVDNDGGATRITDDDAVARGTLLGGGAAFATVYWGTNGLALSTSSIPIWVTEGAFSVSLSGLLSNTTYYYRCFVSNAYGSAWAASATNFATLRGYKTWTGAGGSRNASVAANWAGGVAPTNGDGILLTGASSSNLTWDLTNAVVASWTQVGYTGTVTFLTKYTGFTNLLISGDCVLSNGIWTHPANTGGATAKDRLSVTVGGDFVLAAGAAINLTARGFAALQGPGAGNSAQRSQSPPQVAASHGGRGSGTTGYTPAATYGSVTAPTTLGSGAKVQGGGAAELHVAGTTIIDGRILANGSDDYTITPSRYPGGAGGSIYLTTGHLSGSGALQAVGGNGYPADGGGGRIAVIVTGSDSFGSLSFTTQTNTGAAGTTYLESQSDGAGCGRVLIDGASTCYTPILPDLDPAPLPEETNHLYNASLVIRNGARMLLTRHTRIADLLAVDSGATLDLNGYTLYVRAMEHSLGTGTVVSNGGTIVWNAAGIQYALTVLQGPNGTAPTNASGFYDRGSSAGLTAVPDSGYGFIKWEGDAPEADRTNAAMTLAMDRDRTVRALFGSIAPGSRTWLGHGSPYATNPANWYPPSVPAAGNTVLLDGTSTSNMIWDLSMTLGAWNQLADYSGTVTIATRYPGQGTFTQLAITGDCVIASGIWTHPPNTGGTTEVDRLSVTVGGAFLLASNAMIDLTGRGFASQSGPGAGISVSRVGPPDNGSGAGHGGRGACGAAGAPTTVYGSILTPTNLGSGSSGRGGGALELYVQGTATVEGTIQAAGGPPVSSAYPGNAGGSIHVVAGRLAGRGTIDASGSDGYYDGGGGRIAVVLTAGSSLSNVTVSAHGGAVNGAAGTVYLEKASDGSGRGTLTINNNNYAAATNVMTAIMATPDLRAVTMVLTNRGCIGLEANVVLGDLFIRTNTATRLYLNGHTLTVQTPKHADWGHTNAVVAGGGAILWPTGSMLILR